MIWFNVSGFIAYNPVDAKPRRSSEAFYALCLFQNKTFIYITLLATATFLASYSRGFVP